MNDRYRRSAHLSWFAQRDALFLHHELTGRSLAATPTLRSLLGATEFAHPIEGWLDLAVTVEPGLDRDAMREALALLDEARALVPEGTDEHAALADRVPVKMPWRVVVDDGTSVVATVGRNLDTPPRRLTFGDVEAAIWRALDAERSVAELASALELELRVVLEAVTGWAASPVQLVRLSPLPMSFHRGLAAPAWISSAMPFRRLGETDAPDQPAETIDLSDYHASVIQDADAQFEHVETTLSHLLRAPHGALRGRTYAAALLDGLTTTGWLSPTHRAGRWLEVGGGLGWFAAGALAALEPHPLGFRYTIADLSPALGAAQAGRLAAWSVADTRIDHAEQLATIEDASIDVAISNEAIGDFTTVALRRVGGGDPSGLDAGHGVWEDPEAMLEALEEAEDAVETVRFEGDPSALAWIERAGLDLSDAPETVLFNLGAFRFLEQLDRVLRSGGLACVTEFGDRWRYPVESTHLDHAEVSIHFGQLEAGARALGFEVEVVDVPELLDLDTGVEVLRSSRTWFRNLQALLATHGVRLEKIATTPDALRGLCGDRFDPDGLEVLPFGPIGERIHGLIPSEFKALLLRKPG